MKKNICLFISLTIYLLAIQTYPQNQKDSVSIKADIETIKNIIQQTAKSINEHNPDGIMAHYSKDILVSYPGIPDTRYDTLYARYKQMMKPGIVTATNPVVEEILVSGDLAMIRMIWETTITETETNTTSKRRAKDLQVWRRENGEWKFIRGMWYHMRP